MVNFIKVLAVVAVIGAFIAAGLFWPSEGGAAPDGFEVPELESSLDAFGEPGAAIAFDDIVDFTPLTSNRKDLMSGKFLLSEDRLPWTFTVPIDWSKKAQDPETLNALQRMAIADPFLKDYAENNTEKSFLQAAFFMLDWQAFHQVNRQVTPLAWNYQNTQGRASRLAYILGVIEANPNLLSQADTKRLVSLADFHIKRSRDSVYGHPEYTIEDSPGYAALCGVLNALSSCKVKDNL